MTIEEVLKARIVALNTTAAGRIYRDIIEQEPTLPAIAISRTGGAGSVRDASGTPQTKMARLTVGIVAWTMAEATAVAIVLAPDPQAGAPVGLDGWNTQGAPPVAGTPVVLSCLLRSQLEAPEIDGDHKLRVILQDYEVKFR